MTVNLITAERKLRDFTSQTHPEVIVVLNFPKQAHSVPLRYPIIRNIGKFYWETQISVILSNFFHETIETKSDGITIEALGLEIDYSTVTARKSVLKGDPVEFSVTISANLRYKVIQVDNGEPWRILEPHVEKFEPAKLNQALQEIKELLISINQNIIDINRYR
jgi:hypothetical protein